MKSLALVDADIVAFRCAASSEQDPQGIAEVRTDDMMRKILHDTNAKTYKAYLTGKNNFRYTIYPEYKANRKGKPKPKWLQACRDLLVTQWNAEITDGYEADDALGIEQTKASLDSVICSIDKDLRCIPGWHYNFVKQEASFVSPYEAMRNFYKQLITGDGADNIPAFDGKFRSSVPKFVQILLDPLDGMTDEWEMYEYCLNIHADNNPDFMFKDLYETVERNAQCLHIWKKENDFWKEPERNGLRDEDTVL
jgi:hypothetical protein